jgi:NAD+--dinitrogen-reductase ADP-D-ribosyltransferase
VSTSASAPTGLAQHASEMGQAPEAVPGPGAWTSTNLVGVPAGVIGSTAFNRHPIELSIHGTRESAPGLFRALETVPDLTAATQVFERHLRDTFGLAEDPVAGPPAARRRRRVSYRKLLEGWGFDSNSPRAAVLKGWVESRFGLVPIFHGGPLGRFPSNSWVSYIEQKMNSRFHGNCIDLQLDLLFEYGQWALRRFGLPGRERVTVWRGVDALSDHQIVSGSLRERRAVVRLNSVVSFSLSRAHAEMFGDWILQTEVPIQKLLFFPDLLGRSLLAGEGEVIALGGEYEVLAAYL